MSSENGDVGEPRKTRSPQYRQAVRAAGLEFQAAMTRKGMNANQLAKLVGQQPSTIGFILAGERPEMPAGTFMEICRVLELDPVEVWYGRKPSKHESVPPPASQPRPSNRPPRR